MFIEGQWVPPEANAGCLMSVSAFRVDQIKVAEYVPYDVLNNLIEREFPYN